MQMPTFSVLESFSAGAKEKFCSRVGHTPCLYKGFLKENILVHSKE